MTKRILMVAAENDALPNAKVGGIGDVVRDIPIALANQGAEVHVVLPDYGFFAIMPSAEQLGSYSVAFAGQQEQVVLYKVQSESHRHDNVIHWALGHEYF